MSNAEQNPAAKTGDYIPIPPRSSQWLDDFTTLLEARAQGTESEELLQPKPDAEAIVRHFAVDFMPEEAIRIARVAHIGELLYHDKQGAAIRDDLLTALYDGDEDVDNRYYVEAIMTDLPVIATFARQHDAACMQKQHEFVDIEGLVNIAENTNLESIIIKAALDYSNFQLLEQKEILTEKEQRKMRRIITTIKTIDAPLLELTGFDALATELLSKAYEWELKQSGNGQFVNESRAIFDQLGGRNKLAGTVELALKKLFPEDKLSHQQVTHDQASYEIYFTDGTTSIPGSDITYRVLARLKSVGATAKKMHRTYERQGEIKPPADIVGLTLIGADNESIENSVRYVMNILPEDAEYTRAPNRGEILHVKGSQDFVDAFARPDGVLLESGLSLKKETCDNGYEAVKFSFLYPIGGVQVPIEVQFTHEDSRRASRVGLASHTLFKLTKLMGHGKHPTITLDSSSDLSDQLLRISQRKERINKYRYVVNKKSDERIEKFRNLRENTRTAIAAIALDTAIGYNNH